ncbi:MAG: hypothetical protein J6S38_03630 [Erysipelotrichaceae bacterium]|nr:hypothetical protein [Erysipelotrichaceae bacterium]
MKKALLILSLLLILCGCNITGRKKANLNDRYMNIIELIKEHESFATSSNYYDINVEMAKITEGYRYYITIDNPRIAMYDIELLAIEEDVDYMNNMAANVGIFEDTQYNMIPNQANAAKGFTKGIIASGISSKPETTLYIFTQFKNQDFSKVHSEYFKLDVKYEAE